MLWPNGTKSKPYVTSPFGPRKAPIAGASTYHRGFDSVRYSLIHAIAAGTVVAINVWPALGYSVWIQHDGYFSKSGHMKNPPPVRLGESITEGRIVGVMGQTGTATDDHLHFEVTPGSFHTANTGQVDPVAFISSRLAATAGGKTPDPIKIREDIDVRFIKAAIDGTTRFALITLGRGQETTSVAQANLWAQTFGDAKIVTPEAYKEALYNVARL